ncbi:hypothetical protein ACFL6S_01200 [Candidatus Poribacteria bacterium]
MVRVQVLSSTVSLNLHKGRETIHKFALLVLTFMLGFCSMLAFGQEIHYEQNFDGLADGDLAGQDGWEVGPPADALGAVSVIITPDVKRGPTGKSVEVNTFQAVIREFDPKIDSGVNFLSVWFRFETLAAQAGGDNNTLHVYMGDTAREWNAGPVIRIGAQSGGDVDDVGVHDGGAQKPVGKIKVGEWQHILEIIDVGKQTHSVYLDGALVAEDFAWRNPAAHLAVGWLMIGFAGGDPGFEGVIGYYDNLIIGAGGKNVADTTIRQVEPVELIGKLATQWSAVKAY